MLVDVYVNHVLIPSGKMSQVTSFVESSTLTQPTKDRLISSYHTLEQTSLPSEEISPGQSPIGLQAPANALGR